MATGIEVPYTDDLKPLEQVLSRVILLVMDGRDIPLGQPRAGLL